MNNKPSEYLNIEKNFFECLKSQLKDNLLFYCVVGSLGRSDVITGWSDIDIVLVVKEYSESILKIINFAVKNNSKIVKIGITLYAAGEFVKKAYQDPKTIHYIGLILNKTYKPRVCAPRIKLKLPSANRIKLFDSVDFTKILHALKRELLLGREQYDEKKAYKMVIALLKILLRKNKKRSPAIVMSC